MNKRVKSWCILCYLLGNFPTYGLTFLLSVTLWSESVKAIPKGTGMEIAQPNRAAAEQALQALAEGKRLREKYPR
ncbi:MAG: hypothetical protein DSM106950_33115 [Stigonema ocellatum SAG 48.90 = DSM 106950]|nr:hypothetical protein [Stigonema ocellatum SAG 48.90 = DSM 106950]